MTIHATAITFHDCRIHLEPIGPEPGIPEQRYRFQVEHCASTEAILVSAIRQWVIGTKPPRKCQHCSGTIEGGGFVIVGGGVMHHECFRDAMTSAKKPADRIAELQHELAREKEAHSTACGLVARMHAAAVGEIRGPSRGVVEDVEDLRADAERLRHVASENGKSCLQLHDETKRLRASLQAMAEQSATYMRERDEARAKLAEANMRSSFTPEEVQAEIDAQFARAARFRAQADRLRVAIQAVVDMPPVQCGEYSYLPFVNGQNLQQERIQAELRKALG